MKVSMKSTWGVLILVVIGGVIGSYQYLKDNSSIFSEPVAISGFYGGEKKRFLHNPDVLKILSGKHNLQLDARKAGSIEMVTTLPSQGRDFLWPSNEIAVELYGMNGAQHKGSELIFNSPLVFYSWKFVVEGLVDDKIVEKRDSVYYLTDFKKLLQLIRQNKKWNEIGVEELPGPVKLKTTDPTRSNSGNIAFALIAHTLSPEGALASKTFEEVSKQLIDLRDSMGYMESSSGTLFEKFLSMGSGAYPLIAGYENQLIEYILEHKEQFEIIQDQIVILYPEPTIWSSHPLIALTDQGKQLIGALKTPAIQEIAWKNHGFRSGFSSKNDPGIFNLNGIPNDVTAVMNMPRPSLMQKLIERLTD